MANFSGRVQHARTFVGLVLLALMLVAGRAQAHAVIVTTSPAANDELTAAPDEIRLWFTEPLEADFSRITLHDSSGKPLSTAPSGIDAGDAHQMFLPLDGLPDGLYTVAWRVVSAADGHATDGSFAFGVNVAAVGGSGSAAAASIAPEAAVIRWINLLSLALAVGSVGFWLFVARGVLADDAPLRRLAWVGWAAVGVSGVLMLLLQTAVSAGVPLLSAPTNPALGGIIRETAFGQLWLARGALWLVTGAALWRRGRLGGALPLALVAGVGMLVAQSLFSHAATAPDRGVALAGDVLHLLSAALWVGGLVAFAVVLLALPRDEHRAGVSGRLVAAFSNYVRVAVALLVVSGLYAAWLQVGSIDALLGTVYGRALLVKLLLFVPLLALAGVNLVYTARGLGRGDAVWVGRLRGLVGAEIALAAGVLLATGVMTSGSPARETVATPPPAPPYFGMQEADDQMLHLTITPGTVGENQFTVTAYEANGAPITDASLIRLRFTNLDQRLGESELRPTADGAGGYSIRGANLSIPGQWRIRLMMARPGQFDTVVDFETTVAPMAAAPSYAAANIPYTQRWLAAALTGLALLAVGGFFAARARWRRGGGTALALCSVGLGLAVLVSTAAMPETLSSGALLTNPIPVDAESVAAGRVLYAINCAACHGETGRGDGAAGAALNPPPADLTQHAIVGIHPDGQLFAWITDGFPGSAMPAFKDVLSETERWQIINFVRSLAEAP